MLGSMKMFGSGVSDPYYSNVISLSHWDGSSGSKPNNIDQVTARYWNYYGSTTVLSNTQKKFGDTSLYIPGGTTASHGAYLTSSSDFAFGTGDFTIEAWVYFPALPSDAVLFDFRTGSGQDSVAYNDYITVSGSNIKYNLWMGGVGSGTINMVVNTWYHIACSRASGTFRTFINGTQDIQNTISKNLSKTDAVPKIGTRYSGGGGTALQAYIDDFRITKGVARYTGNFTAPIAPFPNY